MNDLKTRRILTDIASPSWEHPADRAALESLRRVPGFDQVLRALFGMFGERSIRLAFQANAVQVTAKQFPQIHSQYEEVLRTLDAPGYYELFIAENPFVNAGAYGMNRPFIVLHSQAVRVLNEEELRFILGHEVGHVLSGHVLYRTMMALLILLAQQGFPVVGLAARAILLGLMEWSRKAELSSDRAGLLACQNPEASLSAFMTLAGGSPAEGTNLNEFLRQSDEYRQAGDLADEIFKVINLLPMTHPFHVLRAGQLRDWIEAGDYDRILRGEYRHRTDDRGPWQEDMAEAARSYTEGAKDTMGKVADAARRTREAFAEGFRRQ